ncbi:ABC transporter permease, partial [Nocardioides sp. R-C-SC26]|uniref:ABC transporter permease n=1 Tax=Nocardioides sp. R-C-SC26 TaxID=2870414 RepID=UPI001E539972
MVGVALAGLRERKLRLLMSATSIVLGVAFVVGTLIFSDTLNRSFTALFDATVGDVVVERDGSSITGASAQEAVPERLVARLAELPGAARADGQIGVNGVYVIKPDGKPLGGFGPPAIGGNWSDAPAANDVEGLAIIEGREPDGPGEIVLEESTAERAGYEVGDTVPLVTTMKTANLRPTLVGIAGFPDGGSLNGATYVAFETRYAQQLLLEGERAFTSIWITAADGVSQADLRDRAEELLPGGYRAVTGDQAADDAASGLLEAISFLTTFLLIFAGIALVVGSFIIVNTFSILVAQRSRELALLRALGASRRQVNRIVQIEALVLGLVGSALGLGVGVLLAMALRALFGQIGLDLAGQPLVFEPRTVVAAFAVGVVVTMTAAWFPARRTARIAPVQALRDDVALPETSLRRRFRLGLLTAVVGGVALTLGLGDVVEVSYGGWYVGLGVLLILLGVTAMSPVLAHPFLAATTALLGRLFGRVGALAGQNALRNPRRTAATASALMIGLALACTMAIVGDSAKASVDKTVEDSFVGDFVVSSIFGGSFSGTVAERLAGVDGVESVLQQRTAWVERDDGGIDVVLGTTPASLDLLDITLDQGDLADLVGGAVLVSDGLADDEDLELGDVIEVQVPAGTKRWTVVGVVETSPLVPGSLVVDIGTYQRAGFPDADSLLVVYAEPGATGLADRLGDAAAGPQ